MKTLALLMLAVIGVQTQAGGFDSNSVKADCINLEGGNMRRLNLNARIEGQKVDVQIHFTDSDQNIIYKDLKGTAPATLDEKMHYVVQMDHDPYQGQFGNFDWFFILPQTFFEGALDGVFDGTRPETLMGYEWKGTPGGDSNNRGLGKLFHWVCRSVDSN